MAIVEEFSYRAIHPGGGDIVKGTIEAMSEAAVTAKLKAQGLMPLQIVAVSRSGLNRDIKIPGFEKRVKVDSLAIFSKQLSGLINAGLPLMRCLTILAEQTENKQLQRALVAVRADVESGAAFSTALARQPKVFPPLMISIVKVGEAGGFLGQSLASLAKTYQGEAELRNKIRSATTYPIIVFCIAIVGMISMVTFVVPIFENMFKGIGGSLPLPTQILVLISHNMIWILPLLAFAVVTGWALWLRYRESDGYRRRVDPLTLRLPVFGPLMTKIAVARFSRNLSMMLEAGVPLIQALTVVAQASHNWAVEQAVERVQESVRQGKSFAVPLAKANVFPPMVAQMVSVGEESGTLSDMLASIADYYESEVETATEQLTAAIEPILIVGIGILIGGMVVALYLPIFTLYGDLAKQH